MEKYMFSLLPSCIGQRSNHCTAISNKLYHHQILVLYATE